MSSKDLNKEKILSPDTSITNPSDDAFGFAPFAEHLANSLKEMAPSEGIVVAIHGKWGAGKSTLLNFVSHYLNKAYQKNKPIVIRFNPWWFSDREDLTRLYIEQLKDNLGKNKFKKVNKKLSKLTDALSNHPQGWVLKLINYVFGYGEQEDIVTLKNEIGKLLEEYDNKIVVIIDDIDRLNADEIRDLFRTIKAVGNLPNIIYLLAFDKEVVIRALEKEQNISGSDYLEKIVQVPFELPLPNKDSLRTFLFYKLDKILSLASNDEFDSHYWTNVYYDGIDPFIQTPRDIIRYINILTANFPIVYEEVNPVDFFAIEALRIFSPITYDCIRNNPNLFTGNKSIYSNSRDFRNEEIDKYDAVLRKVPESELEKAKKLLKRIFPRFASSYGGGNYGSDFLPIWRRNKRVCSEEIFPIYFQLSVPQGNISQIEVKKILEFTADEEGFKDTLLKFSKEIRPDGKTRIYGLFLRFGDFIDEIPDENIGPVVKALLKVGDEINKEFDRDSGFYGFYRTDRYIWMILRDLLKRLDIDERKKILLNSINSSDQINIIVEVIWHLLHQHNEETENKYIIPNDERIISSQDLEEFKKLGISKIKDAANDNSILNSPDPTNVLFRWQEWSEENEVKRWSKNKIESDSGLLDYLYAFKSEQKWQNIGMFTGDGDIAMRTKLRVNPKDLENFIDLNIIFDRVKKLLKKDSVDQKFNPILERFIMEYEAIQRGEDPKRL